MGSTCPCFGFNSLDERSFDRIGRTRATYISGKSAGRINHWFYCNGFDILLLMLRRGLLGTNVDNPLFAGFIAQLQSRHQATPADDKEPSAELDRSCGKKKASNEVTEHNDLVSFVTCKRFSACVHP